MAQKEANVKFRAETAQFDSAIKSSNSTMTTLRSSLKLTEAEFKAGGDKANYLKEKSQNLAQQLQANADKQAALTSKLEEAKRIFGEDSAEVAKFGQQLNAAKTQELSLTRQLSECNAELKKSETETGQLTSKIAGQEEKLESLKAKYKDQVLALGLDSDATKELADEIKRESSALNESKEKLAAAERATDALTDDTKELGDATDKTAQYVKLSDVIWGNLAAGGISAAISKAKEAAKEIIATGEAYETSMSKVAALSGATGSDLDALSAKAREMGATTTFSASESADALGYMALAGWDTQSMIAGLPGVLSLAQAGEMDLASASDLVTDYLSAFNMTAEDTGRMVDVLAYAQANANTTTEGLGNSFKNCAANANAAGLDIETTSAAISMMANQGLKGSEAGTALNAVLRDMTAKMKDGAISIGEQSVAVMDAEGNYRDFTDIIRDVQEATNGMGEAEKAAALQNTFTADSIKGLNLMLNAGADEMVSFRDELYNCDGAAKATAETMTDNLGGDLANFNSALEETELQLYDSLQGPLRSIVQLGTNQVMPMLQAGAQNLDKIIPILAQVASAIALQQAYLKVIKPLLVANKIATEGMTVAEVARAAATNRATIATMASSTALKTLSAAGPMLAITALATAVTLVADAFGKAAEEADKQREHEEKLAQASDGLRDASIGLGAEIKNVGDALEGEADAIELVDVDALADKHIELANSITEMKSAAMTSVAQLSDYASVIDELGGRSDLSAEEAARLELALAGVNESCGTNYELVRDSGGAYQIMADGAIVAKDAILQVVEAQKYQVQQEALLKEMSATYSQLREDNEKLAQAQRAVTDAQAAYDAKLAENGGQRYYYNQMTGEYVDLLASEAATLDAAKGSYAEIEGQLGTTQSAYNKLTEETTLNQMAMTQGASAFLQAAASSDTFKQNVLACDVDLVNFTQSLESMGFTSEQVSSMSAEQVQALALAWNSGSMSMVDACNQAGIAIPDAMASAEGGFSAHAQGIIDKAAQTSGITAEQFSQLAGQLGASGEGAMIALASGINANAAKGPDAARIVKQAIVLELCKGDVERAAQMLGGDIDAGLAAGISGTAGMPAAAAGIMSQATIDAAKDAFESHSPSEVMRRLGDDVDAGLANGINESEPQPTSAMSTTADKIREAIASLPGDMTATGDGSGAGLASGISGRTGDVRNAGAGVKNAAQNGIASLPGDMTATGDSSGSGLASGINSRMNDVRGAGANVKDAANSGVSGTAALLGGEGSSASSSFASGVMSARGSAESNAFAMADAAANMKRDVSSSWQWGSDLGQGFANGISGMIDRVKSGAVSMANAIRSVLHFSVPDEGPLADADEYGPDFAGLLASGIERGAPGAKRAAMGLARDIKSAFDIDQGTLESSAKAVVDLSYVNQGIEAALSASALVGYQTQIDELEQLGAKLDGVKRCIERLDGGLGRKIAENAPDGYPGDRAFRKEMRRAGWRP